MFRKKPKKMKLWVRFRAEDLTALIVNIFERICCFDEVFLMALTFIERPSYGRFLHNDH